MFFYNSTGHKLHKLKVERMQLLLQIAVLRLKMFFLYINTYFIRRYLRTETIPAASDVTKTELDVKSLITVTNGTPFCV